MSTNLVLANIDSIDPYCEGDTYFNEENIFIEKIEVINGRDWLRNLYRAYKSQNKFITENYKKNFKSNFIVSKKNQNKKNCYLRGRVRLNGDMKDHIDINSNILISSMDIRLKDNLNTYNDFKLLLPKTRKANNEIFISVFLKHLNFLSTNLFFTKIKLVGIENKYLFYENINKEFLERNNYIEGPVIRGDERFFFNEKTKNIISARLENPKWIKENMKNELETSVEAITIANKAFIKNSIEKNYLNDPHLNFDYNLFEGNLFEFKVKKFRLLLNAFGSYNSLSVNDIRLFYDPVYKKFDLIFNDGSTTFLKIPEKINFSKISREEFDQINSLNKDIDNINVNKLHNDLNYSGLLISKDEVRKNIIKLKKDLN